MFGIVSRTVFAVLMPCLVAGSLVWPGGTPALDESPEVPRESGGSVPRSDTLLEKGLLDVTRHGAQPDDDIDDTSALQKAIDEAREKGLVVFVPGGVYLISDTLRLMQGVTFNSAKQRWIHDRREANVLLGSTRGQRPVFRLVDGASGFEEPAKPKPLIWIWSQARDRGQRGSPRPEDEQPGISFNQVFKGIDIDLRARGNAGAVGIRHAGSQGSTLEEVTIWAQGAFAGVYNPPGQGGGAYKIRVDGGRYGIWADHQARYPVLAGVVLRNQDLAAIFWKGQSNLTMAGFVVERSKPGPVVALEQGSSPFNRALTLVDGVIRGHGGIAVDNRNGRSLYMKDVFIAGFPQVVESRGKPAVPGEGSITKVKEYSYTGQGSQTIVNGQVRNAGFESVSLESVTDVPEAERFIERHLWRDAFPSFEDPDAVSITDFGARGDDASDDTEALKAALAKHRKIFVPKGKFIVSDTLRLAAHTDLFGLAKHLSIIQVGRDWKGEPGSPVITTVDDARAETTLSYLMIERPKDRPSIALLEWRAGGRSVVRGVIGDVTDRPDGTARAPREAASANTFSVRGNGGGRWYGLAAEWTRLSRSTRGGRHLIIDGTREPLSMYGLNIERGLSDPQIEIVNARNVAIFYLKSETFDSEGGRAGVLQINHSKNVAIFGYSGNARPVGNAVIQLANSDDVILANIMPVALSQAFSTIRVLDVVPALEINGEFPAAFVRLGNPSLAY